MLSQVTTRRLFFLNDTATTEIYPLSLHDALPILIRPSLLLLDEPLSNLDAKLREGMRDELRIPSRDRKSTRLNSSHQIISYAVFCLKKKHRDHSNLPH